jgi:hypothetical protein
MSSRLPLAVLGVVAVIGCSDGTGPSSELSLSQLAGTWDLAHLEMLRTSDNSVMQDLKAEYGIHASLIIRRGGTAVMAFAMSGGSPDTVNATIALRGDTIVYSTDNGVSYEATVKLSGRSMTWLGLETHDWTTDGGATWEEVRERDTWQRR